MIKIHNPIIKAVSSLPQLFSLSSIRVIRNKKPVLENPSSKESLRILVMSWRCLRHPQSGGSEVNVFKQAQHWADMGHHVTVFTADPGREFAPEKDENLSGIHVIRMGGRFTVYLYAALFLLFMSRRFDTILDVSNGIPFFTPLFTRTPTTMLVNHVHRDQWAREFPRPVAKVGWFLEQRIVPLIYKRNKIIIISPTTEQEMRKLGYKSTNMFLVFCGLDLSVKMVREESKTPKIAYVGRLKVHKRVNLLIDAIDKLRTEFPDVMLDIAGTGDSYDDLAREIQTRGLGNHVVMHGYVSEIERARILSTSTVFAMPSVQEGWGLSVIEANAYGCPAVAYDVPGLQSSIPNNETGLLAKNDTEFVQALGRIIRDEKLRERLSRGALYWSSLFDWEAAALSTLSVLSA